VIDLDPPGGASWGGLARARDAADVVIVGVPFEGGVGGRAGAARGPDHLRGLSRKLKTISRRGRDLSRLRVRDLGNAPVAHFDLPATIARLGETFREIFRRTEVPVVTIGGDHSIGYPIVTAAAEARPGRMGLIWFDAHPDLLDTYLGSRLSHGSPLRRILDDGAVRGEDVLLVGTRAYDAGEPEAIAARGIRELRAAELEEDRAGAVGRYRSALAELAARCDRLYVTIDVDVLDAICVPGTGTPVAGGIGSALLFQLLELIPEPVVGYDIVEYAPVHDVGEITGTTVLALLTTLLDRIAHRT